MKVAPFVISLGLTLVLIVVATLGIWKDSNITKSLNLNIQKVEVPDSGKYIPRDSYLTIHFNYQILHQIIIFENVAKVYQNV